MPNQVMPKDKPTLFATLTELVYCLAILAAAAALCGGLFWSLDPALAEQYWYSFTKDVPRTRVFVSPRPMDCDFSHAPIGRKQCHYKKLVDMDKDESGQTRVTVSWRKVSD